MKFGGYDTTLNAVCPYFTMFPLQFPYRVLERHSKAGELIIDPFCGRGTTNYAARLLGRRSYGVDASRVAVAASRAKLVSASPEEIADRARELLQRVPDTETPCGDFWALAYHSETLSVLCRLRQALLDTSKSSDPRDVALTGIVMGALHGPLTKSEPSYFSNQCPRTYAPKPRYAVSFWRQRSLEAPHVDVLKVIARRAQRYFGGQQPQAQGCVRLGDSADAVSFGELSGVGEHATCVVTSPPYYGLRTYVPDQWLRNWFVGGSATVDYSSEGQLCHSGLPAFEESLRKVWTNVAAVCAPGARLIVRFGAINDRRIGSPAEVVRRSLKGTGWHVTAVRGAGLASDGKRQASTFQKPCSPVTEVDVWARLEA